MFSTNVNFRIGDGHTIKNSVTKEPYPDRGDVTIGNRVWVGMNATILKNAQIPDDCIIGASSVVTKKFNDKNTIIAGVPAKIVKKDIEWER